MACSQSSSQLGRSAAHANGGMPTAACTKQLLHQVQQLHMPLSTHWGMAEALPQHNEPCKPHSQSPISLSGQHSLALTPTGKVTLPLAPLRSGLSPLLCCSRVPLLPCCSSAALLGRAKLRWLPTCIAHAAV
jgi:hypothetical protein